MHKLLLTFGILIFGLQWGIAGNECGVLEEIEAVDDFGETYRGIILKINVLDNDKGDNIKLVEISDYPKGIILNREENGWIEYVLNPSTPLNSKDSLEYVIEDSDGKKDSAQVFINFLEDTPLYGQIYLDCTTLFDCYNCKYLEVNILTGIYPPFEITYLTENYSVSKVLLEGESLFEPACISEWEKYEVFISDSEGNVFYYTSEFWCSHLPYCYPNWKPYELQCNGDGTTTVRFEADEVIEEAYWTAPDGHRQALKDGDIVLDRSYLQFFQMCGGQSDTLVNCFGASDDYLVVGLGRSRLLNIMENDFGKNIEVSEILTLPVCGEFQAWDLENYIYYSSEENVNCEEDSLTYVLTNEFGQKDTAMVFIEVQQEPELILNWNIECKEDNPYEGYMYVEIENGIPPYSVFGTFADNIDGNYFTLSISAYSTIVLEVVDSEGNVSLIEKEWYGGCRNECYEVDSNLSMGYTIECNEDGTANIESIQSYDYEIEKSFWIESDGTYHPLDFAEIGNIAFPNHSYFYVETKQSGHIDGFINCQTADIEAVNDFGSTFPGEDAIINVLANDQGDGLRITQIIESPQCGEILEWSEYGIVVYIADVDTECTADVFVYEVEDNWGEKDTAVVTIFIAEPLPLIVQIERDCTNINPNPETCFFCIDINISIYGGEPPYIVSGILDTVLNEASLLYIPQACIYGVDLQVMDSTGDLFSTNTQYGFHCIPPTYCYPNWKPYQLQCNGDGTTTVEFDENGEIEEAFWTAPDGYRQTLEDGDKVLDKSYLQFFQMCGGQSDTLVNCFGASDDYLVVGVGRQRGFNVLENDFGEGLEVSEILEMPLCGELESWNSGGYLEYSLGANVDCEMDSLTYILTNEFGQKDTATIWIEVLEEPELILTWDIECKEENSYEGYMYVEIENGIPPYSVFGTFADNIDGNYFTLSISAYSTIVLEVVDSEGNVSMIETEWYGDCKERCYEVDSNIFFRYTIECNEDGTANIEGIHNNNNYEIQKSFWIESDGTYHPLDFAEIGNIAFPNHSYFYVETKQNGHIDGFINCQTVDIEAIDDFATTIPDKSVSINLLANDKGDGLRITQIVEPPQCGEILEWSEYGEVVYLADVDTECTVDEFVYEVEDNWGEKDTAVVTVFIEHFPLLIVEAERNCSGTYETGNYSWDIFVYGEMPPFLIDINGQEDTLYESGMISYEFLETGTVQTYELSVRDSTGREFYEMFAVNPCVYLNWFCEEGGGYKPTISCLGEGNVRVEILESLVEDAHWVDFEGLEHPLKQIDTIPDFSFLSIPLLGEIGFDTLLNCLTAHDDFFEISVETPFTFNVLENDFGEEIKVSQIIKMPNCGELIEWSPNGEMTYEFNGNSDCQKDTIIYELENVVGEKTTAIVEFEDLSEKDLYLTWNIYCEESWSENVLLSIQIHGGTPPYVLTGVLNETYNYPELEIAISFFVNEIGFLEVVDSEGQMSSIEIDTKFACVGHPDECYEPKFIHQYLEIECLETGGIIHFLERMNPAVLNKAFWIDTENNYHELSELDTLPNYSYYYFQFKRLGHIDGFINCQTTSIEDETKTPFNSFLQLYPNPNRGQFSLQLQTQKLSLQSFPVRVYNIEGALIWEGKMQGNRLEILDLGNVGSGLYVLQVVAEEEVLVERFWVE